MIVSWLSTVRVIRIFSSAAAAIRISSPTAMAKIFNPIGKRMAPPPSGTQPVAGMGRPARYVADYSGTALLSAGYFIRHFPDTEVAARESRSAAGRLFPRGLHAARRDLSNRLPEQGGARRGRISTASYEAS